VSVQKWDNGHWVETEVLMGVRNDWEKGTSVCVCGACGSIIGPFKTEAELRKNMNNWSYVFRNDMGDTVCPRCIQKAFDDQKELKSVP
jgi:ribosomal protein L34E